VKEGQIKNRRKWGGEKEKRNASDVTCERGRGGENIDMVGGRRLLQSSKKNKNGGQGSRQGESKEGREKEKGMNNFSSPFQKATAERKFYCKS